MSQVTLEVEGLSCGHCVSAVSGALRSVPGVTLGAIRVGSATVTVEPTVTITQLLDAIADAGYSATVASKPDAN